MCKTKKLSETPLHFASKFGSYEVARLFASCASCNKNAKNVYNQTPKDMICTKGNKEFYDQMNSLFEDCFYVSVFRDQDRGDFFVDRPSPKIGEQAETADGLSPRPPIGSENNRQVTPVRSMNGQAPNKMLAAYLGPVSSAKVIFYISI